MRFKKANHDISSCVIWQLNSKIEAAKTNFHFSVFKENLKIEN